MKEKVIGIDLGTTNSCVSVMENGKAVIVPNSEGKRTTPSIVAFLGEGERKVGDAAKRQAVTNKDTIYSIKRFMGSTYDQVEKSISEMTYEINKDSNGMPIVKVGDKDFSPQELSAIILQKMKKTAEDYVGSDITKAVITVPAYFNDSQRNATKQAGEIAGLEVLRIINEPTAAALAYGIDTEEDKTIAVFDVGGGTSDFSILEIGDGVFEVLATDGDSLLGGDDFDNIIVEWIVEEFAKDNSGMDLRNDGMAVQRLRESAEKAKIELSSSVSTDINLPYITIVDNLPQHFAKSLTRAKFDQLSQSLIQRVKTPCINALRASGKTASEIDEVILVGGSTRIPSIQDIAKEIFKQEPNKSVNPDEAVAIGAALQGGVLVGEVNDVLLLDVTSISYGIETMGEVFTAMVPGNTTIPHTAKETFSTAIDDQHSVGIRVAQGERKLFKDNKLIGEFTLDGIPAAQRGVPQIEVTFDIDSNGILEIKAKDLGTGKEQHIEIKDSMSLSEEEVTRMKDEAKANEEADKQKLEDIQTINEADSMVFNSEKLIKDNSDKFSDEDKTSLEEKINATKEAIESKNLENIKSTKEELMSKTQEIGAKMYENTQGCGCSGGESCEGTCGDSCSCNKEDSCQDVDFEEVE